MKCLKEASFKLVTALHTDCFTMKSIFKILNLVLREMRNPEKKPNDLSAPTHRWCRAIAGASFCGRHVVRLVTDGYLIACGIQIMSCASYLQSA